MSGLILDGGRSSSNLAPGKGNSRCVKKPTGHFPKPHRLALDNAKSALPIPSPRYSTAFTKISRCLSKAVATLRSMGCTQAEHNRHRSGEDIFNSPESVFNSAEKVPPASNCYGETSYRSSLTLTSTPETPTKIISSDSKDFQQEPHMCASMPSTNSPYKECHLFSTGSLQLAAALLGTMEPLILRSVRDSTDDWESNLQCIPPNNRWVHRNTAVRPGYCVQIPTIHDKCCSYILSCESEESEWPSRKYLSEPLGKKIGPRLFVAQRATELGNATNTGTRAFIMCNPAEEIPDSQC